MSDLQYIKDGILNKAIKLNASSNAYMFDLRVLLLGKDFKTIKAISSWMWQKIKIYNPQVLFTKGFAAIPLLTAIKMEAYTQDGIELETLVVRDSRKNKNARRIVEGASSESVDNYSAVFVDDLFNSGSTFEQSKSILQKEGYNLNYLCAIVIVDFWNVYGSRKYNLAGFPVIRMFKRHELGCSKADHNLPTIVKDINWRLNNFHTKNEGLLNDYRWTSTPVVHDKYLLLGNTNNNHYCFEKASGNLLWVNYSSRPVKKGDSSKSKIYKNKVFWGSYDGTVKCCELNTGNQIWSNKIDTYVHSSPLLDPKHNRLFIGTEWYGKFYNLTRYGRGDVVCLDMDTGNENWRFQTEGMIPGTVAYSEKYNSVIVGANDYHVYLLNANNGSLISSIPTKGIVKGEICLSDDRDLCYAVSGSGITYCIMMNSGKVLWEKETGPSPHCFPIFYKQQVIVVNKKGVVCSLDSKTGNICWIQLVRESVSCGAVVVNNRILVVTTSGQIVTMENETGKKLSSDKLNSLINESFFVTQPPFFENNNLYVVSNNNGIMCLNISYE